MTYQVSITRKGQITIPKAVRDALKLTTKRKLLIELTKGNKKIEISSQVDFLELAKSIKVKSKISPMKARVYLEKRYERR